MGDTWKGVGQSNFGIVVGKGVGLWKNGRGSLNIEMCSASNLKLRIIGSSF